MARRPFDVVTCINMAFLSGRVRAAAAVALPAQDKVGGLTWDLLLPNVVASHVGGGSVTLKFRQRRVTTSYLMPWLRDDHEDIEIAYVPATTPIVPLPNNLGFVGVAWQPLPSGLSGDKVVDTVLRFRAGSSHIELSGATIEAAVQTPLPAQPSGPSDGAWLLRLLQLLVQTDPAGRAAVAKAANPGQQALRRLLAASSNLPGYYENPATIAQLNVGPINVGLAQAIRVPVVTLPTGAGAPVIIPFAGTLTLGADGPGDAASAISLTTNLNLAVAGLPAAPPLGPLPADSPASAPSEAIGGGVFALAIGEQVFESAAGAFAGTTPPIVIATPVGSVTITLGAPAIEILQAGIRVTVPLAVAVPQVEVIVDAATVTVSVSFVIALTVGANVSVAGAATVPPNTANKFVEDVAEAMNPFGPNAMYAEAIKLLMPQLQGLFQTTATGLAAQFATAFGSIVANAIGTLAAPPAAGLGLLAVVTDPNGWIVLRIGASNPSALAVPPRVASPGALGSNTIGMALEPMTYKDRPDTATVVQVLKSLGPTICQDGAGGVKLLVETRSLALPTTVRIVLQDPIFNEPMNQAFHPSYGIAAAARPTFVKLARQCSLTLTGLPSAATLLPANTVGATKDFTAGVLASLDGAAVAVAKLTGAARLQALIALATEAQAVCATSSSIRNDISALLIGALLDLYLLAYSNQVSPSNALLAPAWANSVEALASTTKGLSLASDASGSAVIDPIALHTGQTTVTQCGKTPPAFQPSFGATGAGNTALPIWQRGRIARVEVREPPKPYPVPKRIDPPKS